MLRSRTKSKLIWSNNGQANIWTAASQDTEWFYFTPGSQTDCLAEGFVPASSWTDTNVGSATTPNILPGGWFVADTRGADFIALQYRSKVTATTGGATTNQVTASPVRFMMQATFAPNLNDPDMAYPEMAALGIVDGLTQTANSASAYDELLAVISSQRTTDYVRWGTAAASPAIGSLSIAGSTNHLVPGIVQYNNDLTQPGGKRLHWNAVFYSRQQADDGGATPVEVSLPIAYPLCWPYDRIAFQVIGGLTSAAAANALATLSLKAELYLVTGYLNSPQER